MAAISPMSLLLRQGALIPRGRLVDPAAGQHHLPDAALLIASRAEEIARAFDAIGNAADDACGEPLLTSARLSFATNGAMGRHFANYWKIMAKEELLEMRGQVVELAPQCDVPCAPRK